MKQAALQKKHMFSAIQAVGMSEPAHQRWNLLSLLRRHAGSFLLLYSRSVQSASSCYIYIYLSLSLSLSLIHVREEKQKQDLRCSRLFGFNGNQVRAVSTTSLQHYCVRGGNHRHRQGFNSGKTHASFVAMCLCFPSWRCWETRASPEPEAGGRSPNAKQLSSVFRL